MYLNFWRSNVIFDKTVIREAPIWYSPTFRLQIRRDWKEKGIMIISHCIDFLTVPLSLEELNKNNDIKINFLDYGKITSLIKTHFEWKDIPDTREPQARNSFLNTILSIDKKGVANLYCSLHQKGNKIVGALSCKWEEKAQLNFSSNEISKSFLLRHTTFKDCYLRYTQFRSLHRRFYTNEKLCIMGHKNVTNVCSVKR